MFFAKSVGRIVEESLQRLREHNQVSSVKYMSSRNVFRVNKKDLTICEYLVKGVQRKRLDTEHDQERTCCATSFTRPSLQPCKAWIVKKAL